MTVHFLLSIHLFCLYSTGNSKTREENQFIFPTVSILHEQGSKFDVHINRPFAHS
jgi:hypothetical protein